MTLQIKEVQNLKDLRAFIQFPHTLYKDNPYWVPNLVMDDTNALRRDKNPAFVPLRGALLAGLAGRQ